ncbi:MAG: methyltransferase [Cyanobacteria bacterium P01_E01_bin.34]
MDWEQRYLDGDTPWDKGEASPGLVDFMERHPLTGSVLVPGCGMGHDVRAIAAGGAAVTGVDLAPSAIASARQFPAVNGEKYDIVDFFSLPERFHNRFDVVFEHTCFCAIDIVMREGYVRSVTQALKPDGYFLAVFYIDPAPGRDGPPHRVSTTELDRLFGPFFTTLEDWQPTQAYPTRIGRERMRLMQFNS